MLTNGNRPRSGGRQIIDVFLSSVGALDISNMSKSAGRIRHSSVILVNKFVGFDSWVTNTSVTTVQ